MSPVMSRADLQRAAANAGPDSPIHDLLKKSGPRRAGEEDAQIEAFATLVGPVRPGLPRDPDGGMIPKFPELRLLYAIPNGGYRTAKVAGRMKAQGVLSTMPDAHLPVMRGPFLSLYLELKIKGRYGTPDQRAMAEQLRAEGNAVIEVQGAEEFVGAVLGYLALPKNRPSARAVCGPGSEPGTLEERIQRWRDRASLLLTPNRKNPPGKRAPVGAGDAR